MSAKKTAARRHSAFTLVELIVVITILAVLATVGFLSLSGYSDDARTATVKANVRTVYSAILAESATSGNSPRFYIDHSTEAALSGASAYLEGSWVFLTGGQLGEGDSNYSAGNPRWDRLRMNGDKFKLAFAGPEGIAWIDGAKGLAGIVGLAPDASAAYSTGELSVGAVDVFKTLANGRKRNVPFFQVAAVEPGSKVAVVTGNFPAGAGIQGLVRDADSQWPHDALADGVRYYYPGCDTADIILPNGQRWAACNVGATKAWTGGVTVTNCAGGASDCDSALRFTLGSYYQWGRNVDVMTGGTVAGPLDATAAASATGFITNGASPYDWLSVQDGNLWGGAWSTTSTGTFASLGSPAAMRGPCADWYHVPTQKEWCDAIQAVSPKRSNGTDMPCDSGWQSEATPNAFRNVLKLPLAGNRNGSSAAYYTQGTRGYYWASSPTGTDGYYVSLSATQVFPAFSNYRAYGFSVRCLKN